MSRGGRRRDRAVIQASPAARERLAAINAPPDFANAGGLFAIGRQLTTAALATALLNYVPEKDRQS